MPYTDLNLILYYKKIVVLTSFRFFLEAVHLLNSYFLTILKYFPPFLRYQFFIRFRFTQYFLYTVFFYPGNLR